MFTLQTSFNPLFLNGGGVGWEYTPLVEVSVNSKKENSYDFFFLITSKNSASTVQHLETTIETFTTLETEQKKGK